MGRGEEADIHVRTLAEFSMQSEGGARSRSSEVLLRELVAGKTGSIMAISLMLKDLSLASRLAIESNAPLLFGQLARGFLQISSNQLWHIANLDEIANMAAEQAGTSFKQQLSAGAGGGSSEAASDDRAAGRPQGFRRSRQIWRRSSCTSKPGAR